MKSSSKISCACQNITNFDFDYPIPDLTQLRKACPVLENIILPSSIWNDYQKEVSAPSDDAKHIPIVLGLIRIGKLGVLTGQIHKHLMNKNQPSTNLDPNYREDLQEKWMIKKKNSFERHKMYKKMSGKTIEMVYSHWLESEGYEISGLAAIGANADIEAIKGGQKYLFEIKYIGINDDLFKDIVASLNKQKTSGRWSPEDTINYIISRIYEATKQLQKIQVKEKKKSVAVVIISALSWFTVSSFIKDKRWIDWDDPSFINNATKKWDAFYLNVLLKKYPDIDVDLPAAIKSVDAIWLIKEDPAYTLNKEIIL